MSDGVDASTAVAEPAIETSVPPAPVAPPPEPVVAPETPPAAAPVPPAEPPTALSEIELPEPDEPNDPPPAPIPNPPLDLAESAPEQPRAPTAPQPAPTPAPVAPVATISSYLHAALEKIQFKKRGRLDKIVAMTKKKGSITNNDVETLLRVSDATATRYLAQLVRDGRLARSGANIGTFYTAF